LVTYDYPQQIANEMIRNEVIKHYSKMSSKYQCEDINERSLDSQLLLFCPHPKTDKTTAKPATSTQVSTYGELTVHDEETIHRHKQYSQHQ